jgi:RNA polymerase sigma-70 factor, ECF subfamily
MVRTEASPVGHDSDFARPACLFALPEPVGAGAILPGMAPGTGSDRVGDVENADLCGLVRAAAGGDVEAFGRLYDETNRPVFGLVLRIVANPADAEEVTVDVYSQLWRQASRFDPARGAPLGWILRIAQSRAIDRIRARTAPPHVDLGAVSERPSGEADPEVGSIASERARAVGRALATLAPDQRTAIELAYFEGLTHVEISERLGVPLGTTKSRIRLAMTKLRGTLSAGGERR